MPMLNVNTNERQREMPMPSACVFLLAEVILYYIIPIEHNIKYFFHIHITLIATRGASILEYDHGKEYRTRTLNAGQGC